MGEVLGRQVCDAQHKCDMVGLMFGSYRVSMYYQTAFKIASAVLMAAKMAARYEGVNPRHSQEIMTKMTRGVEEPQAREYRRTTHTPNFNKWTVAWEKNLVVFTFDEATIKVHYSDAYELYGWLRVAAQNAKRWAGDRSRHWTTQAHLADAEENDKFVYAS